MRSISSAKEKSLPSVVMIEMASTAACVLDCYASRRDVIMTSCETPLRNRLMMNRLRQSLAGHATFDARMHDACIECDADISIER